jgi:hypothetical protein
MAVQTDPHLSLVRPVTPRTPEGCEECLILGSTWVYLRLCLTLWPRRLLRLFPAPARSGPCLRDRAPHRVVVRAGRELALVLCR